MRPGEGILTKSDTLSDLQIVNFKDNNNTNHLGNKCLGNLRLISP